MTTTSLAPTPLLRTALRLDAVVTGLNGAAYVAAAPWLGDVLGLPAGVLRGVGAFLLVFALAVWLVGARAPRSVAGVRPVIALNALWVVGSLAVVLADAGSPTAIGATWIVLQAAVVAAFAGLQAVALRRT